jgi:hypothetical protein
MKKMLLFSFFSIGFSMLTHAQQLQYSNWTRFDTYFNDTVFQHFDLNTCTNSSPDGLLVSSTFTEEGNVFKIQDVSGPAACSSSIVGTYKFTIFDSTSLRFTLVSDACTGRANSLTEGVFYRMPPKTIYIPADFSNIQEGIVAADNYDTVLVSDGIYYEQINFLGKKPLMVASQFIIDGETNHIGNTIIDGSQLTNSDSASVVYFVSGEDTTSVICGFTIQHGKGTLTPDEFGDWDGRQGGGIWIQGAGAKIMHNRITHNTVDDSQSAVETNADGAGIGTQWEDTNFWIVVTNNTIDSNTCISSHYQATGAGISSSYSTILKNNVITYNTITGYGDAVAVGGGVSVGQFDFINPLFLIAQDNTISHNISQASSLANSAGVLAEGALLTFTGNVVSDNQVTDGLGIDYSGGGGMFIHDVGQGAVVSNNIFKNNSSNENAGGILVKNWNPVYLPVLFVNNTFENNQAKYGGALTSFECPLVMHNNIFNGNKATLNGGALFLRDSVGAQADHLATLVNNTFTGNSSGSDGGAIFSNLTDPYIINTIFYNDSAQNTLEEIYLLSAGDTAVVSFSNINTSLVHGVFADGGGNITADPLFMGGIHHPYALSAGSPCIDVGTDDTTGLFLPLTDLAGDPRIWDERIDMGAYEWNNVGIDDFAFRISDFGLMIYPNPFTTQTNINYFLEKPFQVNLRIYDSYGRLVAEPVNAFQQKGEQKTEWNADGLPVGIYYCRLQAGNKVTTNKIVKMH